MFSLRFWKHSFSIKAINQYKYVLEQAKNIEKHLWNSVRIVKTIYKDKCKLSFQESLNKGMYFS